MAKFTRHLRSVREQHGWSQVQLAAHLHIDRSACSRIEAGTRRLALEEFVRLADALHLDPANAMALARELAGEPSAEAAAGDEDLSEEPTAEILIPRPTRGAA